MRAIAAFAVWQAVCSYDASRGVPFVAYARQRVWTSALTRYRQEWVYALRTPNAFQEAGPDYASSVTAAIDIHEPLSRALAQLSQAESWLLDELFWKGRTEVELAEEIGITQQAISKRKMAVLLALRRHLTEPVVVKISPLRN